MLVLITASVAPKVSTLPRFTMPRKATISLSAAGGVTPFTLDRSVTADRYDEDRVARVTFPSGVHSVSSRTSDSVYSQDSSAK
jgi:hypothetical protein